MMPVIDRELAQLLNTAEHSLAAHLALRPDSPHKRLLELFVRVKDGTTPACGYPDARHIFWDTPEDEIEEKCLSDALAAFLYVRVRQ